MYIVKTEFVVARTKLWLTESTNKTNATDRQNIDGIFCSMLWLLFGTVHE